MRLYILSGLLILSACGAKPLTVKYGSTTKADLIALKGEPQKEERLEASKEMLIYPNDEKYQVDNDVVTASFKNPKESEQAILYWRHQFKNCETIKREIPRAQETHTPPEIEMICHEQGTSVIYRDGTDVVSRVVEYEKK